jgi:SAM-dependent methyltransferase
VLVAWLVAERNDEQIEYWNGPGARRWVQHQDVLDRMLEPFGRAALEAAQVRPGERVVDVGCGCGTTSLGIAAAVGEGGAVLGVDPSAPMAEVARRRALDRGLKNARFVVADASAHAFDADCDLLFSRFGVMFFADPTRAFANLRGALRQGGRAAFVCWGPVAENPWFRVPMAAAGTVIPLPEPAAPGDPGPFSLADRERLQSILEAAGFLGVHVDRVSPLFVLGADLDQAATNAIETGPVSRLLLDVDEATRKRVRSAIREQLAPHASAGGLALSSAAWVVTARTG